MSIQELIEKLRMYDEVSVVEFLDLTTDDIIDAFFDRVYDRQEYIRKELEE